MACIRVEGLRKTFLREPALDGLSFALEHGQMLGLIGPGAAGKSLLLKIICGLVKPDAGRVWVDDVEVTALGEAELQRFRSRIGMVFQNYALFDFLDVGENIALPLRVEAKLDDRAIRDTVATMLERVALPGIERKLPNELSGGMKKRVSFARAVVREPPIVFYDDPTAGLDPVTSAKIFRLLAQTKAKGSTSITVSHDLDGIRPLCDRWLLLERGRVLFEGDRDAIERCREPAVRAFWRNED